jgi:hypothetical protein
MNLKTDAERADLCAETLKTLYRDQKYGDPRRWFAKGNIVYRRSGLGSEYQEIGDEAVLRPELKGDIPCFEVVYNSKKPARLKGVWESQVCDKWDLVNDPLEGDAEPEDPLPDDWEVAHPPPAVKKEKKAAGAKKKEKKKKAKKKVSLCIFLDCARSIRR